MMDGKKKNKNKKDKDFLDIGPLYMVIIKRAPKEYCLSIDPSNHPKLIKSASHARFDFNIF